MLWTLDQDDYTGLFCRQGPFPLARKIHELFLASDHSHESELSSSTKTTKSHTKPIGSHTAIQRRTSTSRKPTSIPTQSSSKSKNVSARTQNNDTLYLLVFVLFLL